MRKAMPIDTLMPPIRQAVLAATYGQPERWWYMSELASFANTRPSSLQRELSSLVAAKLLRKRKDGARAYFRAETDSPLFEPLRMLVERTSGVAPALKDELVAFGKRVDAAFIHGSVARGEENAGSDVDLIIVGEIGIADLAPALRKLEHRFQREFNIMCYSAAEFAAKRDEGNHFLSSVLEQELIFLIGEKNVLERLGR